MNRITNLFETKKSNILSVCYCRISQTGDTAIVLKALQDKGIDMVEVVFRFPTRWQTGPVIQAAATQALRNGMSLQRLFEQLKASVRNEHACCSDGYLNPIMQFGFEAFCKTMRGSWRGRNDYPDLPFADYMADYKEVAGCTV